MSSSGDLGRSLTLRQSTILTEGSPCGQPSTVLSYSTAARAGGPGTRTQECAGNRPDVRFSTVGRSTGCMHRLARPRVEPGSSLVQPP